MDYLSQFKAYKYIMNHFMVNYKEKLLETHATMKKAKNDFNKGFSYLHRFYSQWSIFR